MKYQNYLVLCPFRFVGTFLTLNVRTITHVKIICIDYRSYLRAVTVFPAVRESLENVIEQEHEKKMENLSKRKFKRRMAVLPQEDERVSWRTNFIAKSFINVYRLHKLQNTSYWKPFRSWNRLRYFQVLFLPVIVLPDCKYEQL